ncbi:MAG TPA: type II toxin-antitoxin system VapB family antitoxin [Bryobacteraceae bacterium]|nr:type II toxin-antitoxin system VapB family antitoxin [Bryobacteraceae bacterium]
MRTTVRLDDALLTEAKKLAADSGRSLTAVIEDALREVISRRRSLSARNRRIVFPTFRGRGLRPGIDLDNSAALLDIMDNLH